MERRAGSGDKALRERALHVWEARRAAEETHIGAEISAAHLALPADAARMIRIYGDAVARPDASDFRADRNDFPRDFVPEDQRFTQPKITDAALGEIMQIGTANAARPEADDDLVWLRQGIGHFAEKQISGSMENTGFHKQSG